MQVGNEINSGMLWNDGTTPNFATLGQFINSGYDATKAVYPNAKVVVHLTNGYDNANFRWFFDNLRSAGGKWDVIGMSHYPRRQLAALQQPPGHQHARHDCALRQ